ncbi:hypothetical protein GGP41_004593 [Bipolaris sorokiniana]|uniref:NmrA-like domain-containing protein n=2 Tax=Cochliobolus sativus TaxID=45130 RepID=A0A8H6DS85_COCSA|nr:uncharacterized protein COCSADRAFT_195236 [Bipolaris sorokiniana ND90Pr]EMD69420.1 hypothetical protein COCSADRAFT_195236 [Bipolaris sorokiniana ND90Pr]KAF5846556.1 hypothetical protein GGP41_004593 [Bipolaris sorokiniana]
MSKNILAILPATSTQGLSLAMHILSSPSLSSKYTIRALARNPSHPSLLPLSTQGVDTAYADMSVPSSLTSALAGVSHLYLATLTTPNYSQTRATEIQQVKTVCAAALAAGVQYIVFSSMSHPLSLSFGKLRNVDHFDVKAECELYIRRLPLRSAFVAPASFMQNLTGVTRPRLATGEGEREKGVYEMPSILPSDTKVPYIDITEVGKWIGAVFEDPDRFAGRTLMAAEAFYTPQQVARIVAKVTGKEVRHVQVGDEVMKGRLHEGIREQLYEMNVLFRDYGYFGEGEEDEVAWARAQVKGEVTGLEEFLRRIEYKLE